MKTYLGDGCYAEFDGYVITLTTENGLTTTNTIVLEPYVFAALVKFRSMAAERMTPREEAT